MADSIHHRGIPSVATQDGNEDSWCEEKFSFGCPVQATKQAMFRLFFLRNAETPIHVHVLPCLAAFKQFIWPVTSLSLHCILQKPILLLISGNRVGALVTLQIT